nr:MAG TPA: hypothetical protein [Caudoviricetes sp.]
MGYQIKPPLWGIKPGKREKGFNIATGAAYEYTTSYGDFAYYTLPMHITDSMSQTFVSPSTQTRDFAPFAKELIETGTVVLDANRGRMFMWNLPPFQFEIKQSFQWSGSNGCVSDIRGEVLATNYQVLMSPYLYVPELTRLRLNVEKGSPSYERLYLQLTYSLYIYQFRGYGTVKVSIAGCRYSWGATPIHYKMMSFQQTRTGNKSITNCLKELTLPQLLGAEKATSSNGFFILGSGNLASYCNQSGKTTVCNTSNGNAFIEGTSAILARVFLPELFQPVGDRPAILKSSAPIISGCIVRFVKNGV